MNGTFIYSNPTTLYFGTNALSYLNKELKNYGKNMPIPGGYFAGYYNEKPNIVGRKLYIEA